MVTEELLSYIKRERALGLSDESIQKVLLLHGWKEADVTQAFTMVLSIRSSFTQKPTVAKPVAPTLPQELSPLSASIDAEPIVMPTFAERVEKAVVLNSAVATPAIEIKPVAPVSTAPINPPIIQPRERIEHAPLTPPPLKTVEMTKPAPAVVQPLPIQPSVQASLQPLQASPLSNPRERELSDAESIRAAQAKVFSPAPPSFNSARPVTEALPKKRHTALIIVLVLLVLGLGAAGYMYFASPSKVLTTALHSTLQIPTLEYYVEADLVSPTQSATPTSTHISARGMSDSTSSLPKISASLMATIEGATASAEMREIGGTRYIQINELPLLPESDATFFLNKWIKLDAVNTGSQFPEALAPFQDVLSQLRLRDTIASLGDFSFLAVTGTLPDEEINGVQMKHFAMSIEKEKFMTALSGMPDSYLSTLSDIAGTIWIGVDDHLIHRAEFAFKTSVGAPSSKMTLTFSGFNSPVQIAEPSAYQTFSELVLNANTSPQEITSPTSTSQTDILIKTALDSIIKKGKLYFAARHGYKYICGNADVGIAEDIKALKTSYQDSNPICHDAIPGFAVSAELSTPGSYWCVDSTGGAKEMTSPVLSTVCQ